MSSRRRSTPKSGQARADESRPERGAASDFLGRNLIPVLVFLFALFFIITFSNPALFLNDEWITVNQLHQLGEGHQVITNEGKYGTFMNGTPGPYFEARHNLLGYTMMLPVLSLPALWFFGLFGDQFRIAVVLLWSMLPVAMAVLVDAYRPEYARWRGIRWTWVVIGVAFLALLANLAFYYPWPFTLPDAPIETAAVVFTNHLLFAALAAMVYLTCRTIFEDTWFALFGTVACISCSSYIFWAANAKDHMLVTAMVAAVILFLVRYIWYGSLRDAALGFVFIGLLAWARPEVGLTVFLATAIYYVLHVIVNTRGSSDYSRLVRPFTAPFFTLVGAIPLFLNNLNVTGNPLVPAFYVYEEQLTRAADPGVSVIGADAVGNISQSVPVPLGGLEGFISVVVNHFAPSWGTLPGDIIGILFSPESGNMSLVAVCPLIIFAVVVLPIVFWKYRKRFNTDNRRTIVLIAVVGIAIWAAYLRSLHGLNISSGIIPDIRYLMPFYLPAGVLGVYAIRYVTEPVGGKEKTFSALASVAIVTPLTILALLLFQPFGGRYSGYTQFFSVIVSLLLLLTLAFFALHLKGMISTRWLIAVIALLIAVPLGWQMMMVFLYSVAKFNGYPLWVPMVEMFLEHSIGMEIAPP